MIGTDSENGRLGKPEKASELSATNLLAQFGFSFSLAKFRSRHGEFETPFSKSFVFYRKIYFCLSQVYCFHNFVCLEITDQTRPQMKHL